MDNLRDLLDKKNFSEPPEIGLLKTFIMNHYKSDVSIKVEHSRIIIVAPGSALASSLHLDILKLQAVSKSNKKIVIYIG